MKKSIATQEDKRTIYSDFQSRWKQKWYNDTPCFHWKGLKYTEEFQRLIQTELPSVWFLTIEEEINTEEKRWKDTEIKGFLYFLPLGEEIYTLSSQEIKNRIEKQLKDGFEIIKNDRSNLLICYREGTTKNAKVWRTHFEKILTE